MTKDFAKKSTSGRSRGAAKKKQPKEPSSPLLKAFVFGTVFGVVLCLAVQWMLSTNADIGNQGAHVEPEQQPEPAESELPELNFYETLPSAEVVISEDVLAYQAKKQLYILQAGSFRQAADADALRLQLILLNLDAEVREFEREGELWHRVIVGPFTERTDMAKTRSTLLENDIQSLLLTQAVED